jgi:hypothetical protein
MKIRQKRKETFLLFFCEATALQRVRNGMMILGQFNIENIHGGGQGKNKNKILFHFCAFSE